jgi:hypothetical protein
MTARELILKTRRNGIRLFRHGVDGVRYEATRGQLDEQLLADLRRNKEEVLAALTTYPCTECAQFNFGQPKTCFWCRRARGVAEDASTPDIPARVRNEQGLKP